MAVEATPAQLPLVAARLLLAAFYFYFMLGLSFSAALLGAIATPVAIYSLFVLLCANLIGGAGCYALEYANRVAFLERRRLAEVATHDGLTGLLNRAALEEQARSLWQQAQAARCRATLRRGRDHRHTDRRRSRRCGQRGRDGWSFHEPAPAEAGDLPHGDGGLLKAAS
jgi:hypothetical protein